MADNSQPVKKNSSLDWFLRGALAKIGEMLDTFTGRNWKPSSSLATSELIERLKILLDSKVRDSGARGKFVPHRLTLKMQWNKFSAESEDSETALNKLKNELLTAAVDHINDRRYHTFAPLELQIKQDYFTEGVKLSASFGDVGADDGEMNVTVPEIKIGDFAPAVLAPQPLAQRQTFLALFTLKGISKQQRLVFENNRRLTVGRTAANNLAIDDPSVSKIHASLVLSDENRLMIADTGSTNGTFIGDQRISYGKAQMINDGDKIKFGTVEVNFVFQPEADESTEISDHNARNSIVIGDFEFKSKSESKTEAGSISAKNIEN